MVQEAFAEVVDRDYNVVHGLKRFFNSKTKEKKKEIVRGTAEEAEFDDGIPCLNIMVKKSLPVRVAFRT